MLKFEAINAVFFKLLLLLLIELILFYNPNPYYYYYNYIKLFIVLLLLLNTVLNSRKNEICGLGSSKKLSRH